MNRSTELVGLSAGEVQEAFVDQAVSAMPSRYVEFLRVMGRSAGPLLAGTDAFYPSIIGIKQDGLELLNDCGAADLLPDDSIVFAMHQGYQVYWMSNLASSDPPVFMYQEGDRGISRTWESFTEFLRHELPGNDSPTGGARWR